MFDMAQKMWRIENLTFSQQKTLNFQISTEFHGYGVKNAAQRNFHDIWKYHTSKIESEYAMEQRAPPP